MSGRRTRPGRDATPATPAGVFPSEAGLEHRLDHPADQLAADLLAAVVHRVLRRARQVRGPAPGGGADDHLDLALLDLEEASAVLTEEVVEATGVEQLLEVTPGIAHQRQVDDVAHLSRGLSPGSSDASNSMTSGRAGAATAPCGAWRELACRLRSVLSGGASPHASTG